MDIIIEQYYRDKEEDGIRTFRSYGKIGLHHLKSGTRTMPSFDRIVTSPNYIFVQVDGKWGMLDKELRFILPISFKEIVPVRKVDVEAFISAYMSNEPASDNIIKPDYLNPTHIAVQSVQIKYKNEPSFISPLDCLNNYDFEECCKADVYEIINNMESMPDTFVLISKESTLLVDIRDCKIERQSGSTEYYQLYHYKENLFVCRNSDETYGFVSYRGGRFFNEVPDSSSIIFHKKGFVSIRLGNRRNQKYVNHVILSELSKQSGKWALFKFGHKKALENWEETEIACLQQLSPFAFTEALEQIGDSNEFVCREMGKEWLVKYDNPQDSSIVPRYVSDEDSEKASSLIDEYYHSGNNPTLFDDYFNLCFTGALKVSSEVYNEIKVREDGLFNIWTDDGCGLCDENMKVLIPARYDDPIEQIEQLMIVSQNGKYGVINDKAEEIIPCVYTSVKIGTDRIEVWNYSSEYDDYRGDWKSQTYIGNQCDIPINYDDRKDNFFIVGINTDVKKGIFGKLRLIPNHYSNNKIFGSLCDIYLPTGEMITHFSKIPQGGIEYSKEDGLLTSYERVAYSEEFGEFLECIRLHSIETHKTSPQYTQIYLLNKNHFLAFENGVGVVTINPENEDIFQWSVPHIYIKISLPINNIIYAWRWQNNKKIIDIYDLSENYKLISSIEYIDSSLSLDKEHIKEGQRERLINLDEIDNIKYFPFNEDYYDSNSCFGCSDDSYDNYRDAFEDDPEAMWGRLD